MSTRSFMYETPHGEIDRDAFMRMLSGYQATCVIGAAAELEIFDQLTGAPRTPEELAAQAALDVRACRVLLDALRALGILEKHHEAYSVRTPLAPLLRSDAPQTLLPAIHHWMNCMRAWSQLALVVRNGTPAERHASIRGEEADRAAFIAAMHSLSAPRAEPLIAKLLADIGPFNHLLDLGGASGTWTLAFLHAMPDARATIFDLPHAIALARQRVEATGLADHISLVGGDFYVDPLPRGADLAWVSAIIHQHAREDSRILFQKVHEALEPGGRIAIRDVVMDASRARPVFGALFAINMLVNTARGGTFTFDEIREDLEATGFEDARLALAAEDMDAVVVAKKP